MLENGQQYHVSITKEELAQLPMVQYQGNIHMIDRPEEVDQAIHQLRMGGIIGFDTETRPCFKKGHRHTVALLQLSTRTDCWLFRLNHIGLPKTIVDFLEDPKILKIGLSIHDDFHNLRHIKPINPEGFIDLQPYVKDYMISDNSLARIYAILFGKRISKSQQLTNWEATELTQAQQRYASLDALACINIYDYIEEGKFHPEESKYYREVAQPEPKKEAVPEPTKDSIKEPAKEATKGSEEEIKPQTEKKQATKATKKKTASKNSTPKETSSKGNSTKKVAKQKTVAKKASTRKTMADKSPARKETLKKTDAQKLGTEE
ncbi:MAG: hypothetical protein NC097_00595 [Clostridium sp.]|nr:hypothetical protein [Clostridium sp.]